MKTERHEACGKPHHCTGPGPIHGAHRSEHRAKLTDRRQWPPAYLCGVCLLALAYRQHPSSPLVVMGTRDEFLDRPAEAAHFWPDAPHLLAGRDLRAGGTWMGITRHGRFAALTNHRDLRRPTVEGPSRGHLVRQALEQDIDRGITSTYAGLNLIHGAVDDLHYLNNITPDRTPLAPGIHGLSNALLNTPWPKVQRAKAGLEQVLNGPEDKLIDGLFDLLTDEATAPEEHLPDTGLTPAMERALSSIFIRTPGYGTRCSTVVLVDHAGHVHFQERSWPHGHTVVQEFVVG
jgi:uncharacterized protein with NRDE domain